MIIERGTSCEKVHKYLSVLRYCRHGGRRLLPRVHKIQRFYRRYGIGKSTYAPVPVGNAGLSDRSPVLGSLRSGEKPYVPGISLDLQFGGAADWRHAADPGRDSGTGAFPVLRRVGCHFRYGGHRTYPDRNRDHPVVALSEKNSRKREVNLCASTFFIM